MVKRASFSLLPKIFSKQSFLFTNFIAIQCSRRVPIGLITNWIPVVILLASAGGFASHAGRTLQ